MKDIHLLYCLFVSLIAAIACDSKSSHNASEEQLVRKLVDDYASNHLGDGLSYPIGRISKLDSAFTEVSKDDDIFIQYVNERNKVLEKIGELDNIVPYPFGKYLQLDEEYDKLTDKMMYRKAVFQPKFRGYSCLVETNHGNFRNIYEILLDSTKTNIVSVDYASGNYFEEYGFCDFEFFQDSTGFYGIRDYYFKDTLVQPCIESYSTLRSLLPSSSRNEFVVTIQGKKQLLEKSGDIVDDVYFDEPVKCTFEDYTYSDILLIKNDGKYGVVNLSSDKFVVPCIFDDCSISSSRIFGTINGEKKEYYPDGTEINKAK